MKTKLICKHFSNMKLEQSKEKEEKKNHICKTTK